MTIEFLGHKKNLLQFIVTTIRKEVRAEPYIIADLFSGTGTVSAAFKQSGYSVIANDNLVWCSIFAEAILLNSGEPLFSMLLSEVGLSHTDFLLPTAYDYVLAYLNSLPPVEGFIYRSYSPASKRYDGVERMYFTEENAGQIDAIRSKIREWKPLLTRGEHALLLADLIRASNAVSNIAGTYGCYLKHWKQRALGPLTLRRSATIISSRQHRVFCGDANGIAADISCDVVYADPPYTKRQYAAYYHILETIAIGDQPHLEGSTGLRPWKQNSSDYCYKNRAPNALKDLISKLDCKYFFLSYNEDGQMSHDAILDILSSFGSVRIFETRYRRYKSSARPHKGNDVLERLYCLSF